MLINIAGIDKFKLFVKLYNYIQTNTTFGAPERRLKTDAEARQLLFQHRNDYAHFGIFCDLKQDVVNSDTFNTIYGNGTPVFENMVEALKNGAAHIEESISQSAKNTKVEKNAKITKNGTESESPSEVVSITANINETKYKMENRDRIGRLHNNELIYFKQTPGLDKNHLNSIANSLNFSSLGISREGVLKILLDTTQPEILKFIVAQMMQDVLAASSPDVAFSFVSDTDLSNSLKAIHGKLNSTHIELAAITTKLKEKYWLSTGFARAAEIQRSENWTIKPQELLVLLKHLSGMLSNETAKQSDYVIDIKSLSEAILNYENLYQNLNNALHFPTIIREYVVKAIPADCLNINLALAWAIAAKRTLRIWKQTNPLEQAPEVTLVRDTTDVVLDMEPGFQDLTPIDIIYIARLNGGCEDHYEKLFKVETLLHIDALPLDAPPPYSSPALIFSSKVDNPGVIQSEGNAGYIAGYVAGYPINTAQAQQNHQLNLNIPIQEEGTNIVPGTYAHYNNQPHQAQQAHHANVDQSLETTAPDFLSEDQQKSAKKPTFRQRMQRWKCWG